MYRAVGGGGVGGFGWFVESDFFYPNEVANVKTGGEFFCELRGEWVVRREGGVEGFDSVVDEASKVSECESVFGSIFPEEKADANSVE